MRDDETKAVPIPPRSVPTSEPKKPWASTTPADRMKDLAQGLIVLGFSIAFVCFLGVLVVWMYQSLVGS